MSWSHELLVLVAAPLLLVLLKMEQKKKSFFSLGERKLCYFQLPPPSALSTTISKFMSITLMLLFYGLFYRLILEVCSFNLSTPETKILNEELAWTTQAAPGHLGLLSKKEGERERGKTRKRRRGREERVIDFETAHAGLQMRLAGRKGICLICSRPWVWTPKQWGCCVPNSMGTPELKSCRA